MSLRSIIRPSRVFGKVRMRLQNRLAASYRPAETALPDNELASALAVAAQEIKVPKNSIFVDDSKRGRGGTEVISLSSSSLAEPLR